MDVGAMDRLVTVHVPAPWESYFWVSGIAGLHGLL